MSDKKERNKDRYIDLRNYERRQHKSMIELLVVSILITGALIAIASIILN